MDRKRVQDLLDKDNVDEIYLVKERMIGQGKNGRPFMSLKVGDASGTIDARLWDRVEELTREFDIGDVIRIKGQIQLFQNRKQLIIHRLERVESSSVNLEDFMPKASKNVEDMLVELLKLVRSMKNDHLRQLVLDTLEDPEIKPMILRAPAAKSIHHAWVGGLMEHILSFSKIMDFRGSH